MSQNRPWTQYEDKLLKFLKDQQGIQKWSTIAQKMAQQYSIKGRNGKQCKQRYMEVFDLNNSVLEWDYDSEQLLFMLHDNMGNKWANIGQQLNNRTDNDVKNHFYSKIRKGLRKLNSIIKSEFKKQFKQIKQNILYKILQGAEDRFTMPPIYSQQVWDYCRQAKNIMLRMGYDEIEYNKWNDVGKYKVEIGRFVESLFMFGREYQRKPKGIGKKGEQQRSYSIENTAGYFQLSTKNRIKNTRNKTNPHSPQQKDSYQQQHQYNEQNSFSSGDQNDQRSQKEIQEVKDWVIKENRAVNRMINNGQKRQMQMQQNQQRFKGQRMNPVIILKSSADLMIIMDDQMISTETQHINYTNSNDINSKNTSKSTTQTPMLLPSIPKLSHISTRSNAMMVDEDDEDDLQNQHPRNIQKYSFKNTSHPNQHHHGNTNKMSVQNDYQQDVQFQLMKQGLLQQQDDSYNNNNINPNHKQNPNASSKFSYLKHPPNLNYHQTANTNNPHKIKSIGSNFSQYSVEEDESQFFTQDSTLNMRIFTTGIGGKMQRDLFASTQKSDKLFKSLDGSGKLFQSLQWKGKFELGMSIQRSGEMKSQDFMGFSIQK